MLQTQGCALPFFNTKPKQKHSWEDTVAFFKMLNLTKESRPFMYNKIFLKKENVGSSHLYASFGTFCAVKLVNYSRHSEILNFRKNSKSTSFSYENSDLTVFKHFFKDSLCFKKLTNLNAKGAKRSVKM